MSNRWLVILAFAAVYLIWGSTYFFNYQAIQAIPPFLMSGTRFLTAGLLLYGLGVWRGAPSPTWEEWRNTALMGFLFLTVGTGAVVWALHYIDTGMAALLVAADPLLIMLLLWLFFRQSPGWRGVLGGVIGIVGTILLVGQPQLKDRPGATLGLLAMIVALISWAVASIYVSRIPQPQSRWRRSAMQMLGGGGGLLLLSLLSGEAASFRLAKLDWMSVGSWLYLIFFGSIIAFSSFNFLLSQVSPEKVATSTYVNPIVALFLGWAFNDEVITTQSLLAGAVLLTGVFFINSNKHQE
ncbi:MAG: EamA family transporter [Bacteroidetes bacterium]|nr:MAG: EamA family transporter [Bacteroidota bacterium]